MSPTRNRHREDDPVAVVSDAVSSPASIPSPRRKGRDAGTYFAQVAELYIVASGVKPAVFRTWTWLDWKAQTSSVAKASYPEIAAALAVSESTAERHVQALLRAGWLTLIRPGKGHGRAHYGVVNPARSGVIGDDPTEVAEVVTDDDPESSSVTEERDVVASPLTPLLESQRDVGQESADVGARDVREVDDDVATFLGDLPEPVEPEHPDDDEAERVAERVAVARLLDAFPASVLVTEEVRR